MRQHRLIYDVPMVGARNMAVDEAVMRAVAEGSSPPTLRLYAWDPACLSLGYGQRWHDADLDRIAAYGWQVVRRTTGGRAILHTNELTYSIALPAEHPLAQGSILESYRRISRALVAALEALHMQPQADKRAEKVRADGPVCFEVPSHYEITTPDGRKLVGSAQLRRQGAILQHGSLPLYGDVALICEALSYPDEDARAQAKAKVRTRAATLQDALGGVAVSWAEAAEAVVNGFREVFDMDFTMGDLTDHEMADADRLVKTQYGTMAWTQRL